MKQRHAQKKGFTLVETIEYIGILAILMIPLTALVWTFLGDQVQQSRRSEVTDGGTFALATISETTRSAASISANTVYDTHPGSLEVDDDGTTVVFDTYERTVTQGSQDITIRTLRMTEGASPAVDLTSDDVTVDNFTITDLSPTGATTIEITLQLSSANPSNNKTYYAQNSWTTTITLRR